MTQLSDHHHRRPDGLLRARGAGVGFPGRPGPFNAITDVPGVEVGYQTLISGTADDASSPVIRTGVTAILPLGMARARDAVWSGVASLNGNGEMTGFPWIEESGRCEGPITLTNTHSLGVARDATIGWLAQQQQQALSLQKGSMADDDRWWLPVAAETWDGWLNDINGQHIGVADVIAAIESARSGPIAEGSVGGGTGMRCYEFKAGSGTASRQLRVGGRDLSLGVFVQANFGARHLCTLAGVPVGEQIPLPSLGDTNRGSQDAGSLIAIVATDAPLLPHQLRRIARRCGLGMARGGGIAAHYSGDLFLAFSTQNTDAVQESQSIIRVDYLPDQQLTPLFEATVQATDEAIANSFVGTPSMTGLNGHVAEGLPVEKLQTVLAVHNRLVAVD